MIEDIIKEVPHWQGHEVTYTSLSGGITNENYKVDVGDESFVVCVSGAKTSLLGIDRERERAINKAVAELGIAPEVIHATQDGHLVTRFIEGASLSEEDVRQHKNITRIANTIRKFHSISDMPWYFCAFNVVKNYTKVAEDHDATFPEEFPWLLEHMQQIEQTLQQKKRRLCLCHNDLLSGNFIDDGEIRIIDWEYAGIGDPFFDMANFSTNHCFDEEHDKLLLRHYLDREITDSDIAHLNLMKIMSDFREAMWAQVQTQISDLDEDFPEYAEKHFNKVSSRIKHPDFNEYLKF